MHLEARASPRGASSPECRKTLLGGQAVDVSLDVGRGVDAFDGIERDRRDGAASPCPPGRAALAGQGLMQALEHDRALRVTPKLGSFRQIRVKFRFTRTISHILWTASA